MVLGRVLRREDIGYLEGRVLVLEVHMWEGCY